MSEINKAGTDKFQLPNIKQVIAVASGKGGVGKSTISANLALAMAARGKKIGLLDADIYGPSQGTLLGVPEGTRPEVQNDMLQPVVAHGIQCMSMSFVTSEKTPAIWRGPMASGALQQLLTQTQWRDLDYLIVDMPPGTGDIQLTLAQRVPLSGAVIVTTPQDVALLDARKGIEMFRRVAVPIIGIIENMSTHVCSACGHEDAVFGTGGGEAVAREYETEVIARLPLSIDIRIQSDLGVPIVVSQPDSPAARAMLEAADKVIAGANVSSAPVINIFDD